MSEVVVVVLARAKPGRVEEGVAAFGSVAGPTHAEEGCIAFALHRAASDPDLLVLVERWASREALDAHLASEHLARFRTEGADLWAEPFQVVVTTPEPVGDPSKGSLAA